MMKLTTDDFAGYYRELHGQEARPFPWQSRLMRHVAEHGTWPKLLDLPTGTGKTTALDIGVFAQALDAARPAGERVAPRRIVLVVDRRTIVDQAHERALKIASRLVAARAQNGEPLPILAAVSERLRSLAAEGAELGTEVSPLGVHLLRGGMPRDDDWARSPTQPLVAVSTVDQIGSRLLFRGYGLSSRMQAVHTGLLANDVLFLLDEVHLARPFRDLLAALQARYRNMEKAALPDRWQVVQMSATAGTNIADSFTLDGEDRAQPKLARRLSARKPTELRLVESSGSEPKRKRALAKAIAAEAEGRFEARGAIGIVVNRVQTARMIFDELAKPVAAAGGALHLVTGRMRPVDREDLELQLRAEVGSDRDRAAGGLRVVVATQCIEAGADFDFDALLTECASLDALRQRFGRLDRLGESSGAPPPDVANAAAAAGAEVSNARLKGVVFGRDDQVADDAEPDPVYGSALRSTWNYLSGLPSVDFGLSEISLPQEQELLTLLAPARQGPLLLPAHLDAWVQTSPPPQADPEPALWLHGSEPREAEVTLVWRADLSEHELRAALSEVPSEGSLPQVNGKRAGASMGARRNRRNSQRRELEVPDELGRRLEACPPRSMEALSIPLAACRNWLRKEPALDVSDAGALPTVEDPFGKRSEGRPVVVWRRDQRLIILPSRLAPGDVVVAPSSYGGLSAGTWEPDGSEEAALTPVLDWGDRAQLWQRGRAQLRLHPAVLRTLFEDAERPLPSLPELGDSTDPDFDPVAEVQRFVLNLPEDALKPWARALRKVLTERSPRELRLVELDDGAPFGVTDESPRAYAMLMLRRPLGRPALNALMRSVRRSGVLGTSESDAELPLVDSTSDAEQASLTGVEVTLAAHLRGVADFARGYATACGLSEELCAALELAGHWHDLGKADPRFQRWLHQGSAFRASVAKEPLAKSNLPSQDAAARERARLRSGYPRGARHELMSLALMGAAASFEEQAGEHWDLVQYLVGSHHGWCRPFAPFIEDSAPVDVTAYWQGQSLSANSEHRLERLDSGVPERFWLLVRRYGWYGLAWLEALFRLADHRRSEAEVRLALTEKKEEENAA